VGLSLESNKVVVREAESYKRAAQLVHGLRASRSCTVFPILLLELVHEESVY
jgi:hypothetical protein